MPFITAETTKKIRQEIKKQIPNVKFSITTENHSTLNISIMKSPVDFGSSYIQINEFYIEKHWSHNKPALNLLQKIEKIVNEINPQKENHYDSDYGSIPNFYLRINVGKWNKPHEISGGK